MQLLINPEGGIAGDMFAAALINAGAEAKTVTLAMQKAAEKLGRASVRHLKTKEGCSRLQIEVEHHHGHLSSFKAMELLESLFEEQKIREPYRTFGQKMLAHLIKAEKEAHETYDFDMEHNHHHHHGAHNHHGHHHHHHEPEAWLHEAQDILIDVMGATAGLQELSAPVRASLTAPVHYGGGSISFSHGNLKVPAPATEVMIRNNKIPVKKGPIETELFTPTGAALLSALQATEIKEQPSPSPKTEGCSRGTKELPIEPLKIYLFRE